ncbi:MAG: PAS domain S-box protein [Nitrospirae bacterium]|nr:PAS domain S-box protein [Nitrospirota bacterium]
MIYVGWWFQHNLDIVYFFYGLGFFSMGIAIIVKHKQGSTFKLAGIIWMLAVFALVHGMNEWLDMLLLSRSDNKTLTILSWFCLIISYGFLFEFGRNIITLNTDIHSAGSVQLFKWWLTPVIITGVLIFSYNSNDFFKVGHILVRYLLGFPGSLLTAIGFYSYYQNKDIKQLKIDKYFLLISISFLIYACLGGMVAPKGRFFPSNWLNTETFLLAINIPVQVFRTSTAVIAAVSIVGAIKLFNWEARRKLEDTIIEHKNLAEYLTELEKEWNTIFNSISDMVTVHDKDFNIIMANDAFVKFAGMHRVEVYDRKCYEIVHNTSHPLGGCPHKRCLISNKTEIQIMEDNKTDIPLMVTTSPIFNKKGKLLYTVHIAKDVTEQKLHEAEMTVKTYQLQKLNENLQVLVKEEVEKHREKEQLLIQQSKMAMIGEMMGNISHQWRQPLNTLALIVQDISEAYEMGELNREYIYEAIQHSMQQIKFMSKTIDDFRTFFRPSKNKAPFKLQEAFDGIQSIISSRLKTTGTDLKIIFHMLNEKYGNSPGKEAMIIGYHNEFQHVIINIINNAIDAVTDIRKKGLLGKGEIITEILEDNRSFIIRITDNGGGISPEIKDRIFEPYFTTKGETTGTGIGLYMSKTIIEDNMDGRLYFENVGNGTVFTIELPKSGGLVNVTLKG